MNYVYKDPLDSGYTQFKLSKKQHNQLFKYRQIKWCYKCEYYYDKNCIILHIFVNWKGILVTTLSLPVLILIHGLTSIKEIKKEMKELYNQKKYGSFSGDTVWSGGEKYKEIMEIIKG